MRIGRVTQGFCEYCAGRSGIDLAAAHRIISRGLCRSHRVFGAKDVTIAAMVSLNIVGFASGSPLSQMAMARLARDHRLAAIVGPPLREGLLHRLRRAWRGSSDPLADLGVPLIDASDVARYKPDVIVVASFPRIIPKAVFATARIGALNMHASALPRHRGIDGIFGTYWDDDRDAAMTIHWINERIDAGDIAAQEVSAAGAWPSIARALHGTGRDWRRVARRRA